MQNIYDGDTGVETVESLLARKDVADVQTIEDAAALESMKSSKGFALLTAFLSQNVDFYRTKLLNCTEMHDVIRCQEIIKSCQMIPAWIDTVIDQARLLHEEKVSKSEAP